MKSITNSSGSGRNWCQRCGIIAANQNFKVLGHPEQKLKKSKYFQVWKHSHKVYEYYCSAVMPYGNHAIISNMFFIVMDQTDLLKETEIFLTWLLLLSVCHCHSSILHHRLFPTTFLFHYFLLLRSFGQQHTAAEHFVLSAVFLVYVARQSWLPFASAYLS